MKYKKTYSDIQGNNEPKFTLLDKAIIVACAFSAGYFSGHIVYWWLTH